MSAHRSFLSLLSEIKQIAQEITRNENFSGIEMIEKAATVRKEVLRQVDTLKSTHLQRLIAALSLLDDIVRDQLNIYRLRSLERVDS